MSVGMAALYRYVPNTRVRWSHALVGGLFVAIGLELAKKLLSWYLSTVPTYSVVYGTFASVPILLVWIYLAWVIVLLGAVVTAYLPSLLSGIARRADTPGWSFMLALEMLQLLRQARAGDATGHEPGGHCPETAGGPSEPRGPCRPHGGAGLAGAPERGR